IELKRDANANVVLNNLFKFTQMQETFGAIMLALVDKVPKILNLREMIDAYITHQKDVITRRTQFDLKKAEEHLHLLEGYKLVVENIDEVVSVIRRSASIADAKLALSERFGLSEIQATAIVQMPLGRLSGMERDKIEADYQQTTEKIASLKNILENESVVLDIVKEDLTKIKEKYGDERRTEISLSSIDIEDEDLIEEEDVVITLTHTGYTKRVPIDTYKSQHRGGRGISGMATKEEDFVEHMLNTSTHNHVLFFTNRGIVYRMKGYQIPEASRQAKGTAIVNLLPLEQGEKITAMIAVASFDEDHFLTFITKDGTVKKTDLMAYAKIRNGGLRAIEIAEGDELISVHITDGTSEIMIGTHNGIAIRFAETDVRPMGRTAHGVRGIKLKGDDYVVGAVTVNPEAKILTITENGYGKKTDFDEYKVQSRGGMGLYNYKVTEKTGNVAGLKAVTDEDDVMIITSGGIIIRTHTGEISTFGRQTQGVRIMKLANETKVVSIETTPHIDEEEQVNEE
ncbi:MAG: DNA gyrase subunit A, partial [Ruminococcaceae bacterium]|nr:DNA gyrase subunit A [Oscillospiraceae bacterium]